MSKSITRRTALKTGAALAAAAALPFDVTARQPKKPAIEGYTDQLSYAPGEDIKLYISSELEEFDIVVSRIGAKPEVVAHETCTKGRLQPIPKDASSHGCKWDVTTILSGHKDWKSGYYLVEFLAAGKKRVGSAFFVVRPQEPGKSAKILLQLSTNTYNAYTNWNGYSLYAYHGRHKVQGRRVSFDRPLYSQFNNWEAPFVKWAESNGYALDYCVNSDLEFHPELLKHYKLVLSVGHDEYWSSPMRDNLEKYIENGGNVAFFSGNTCCWQVRSEENGRALACWKQSFGDDPYYKSGQHKLLTSLWSHYLDRPTREHANGRGLPVGRLSPQPRPVHGWPRLVHRAPPRPLALRRDEPQARRSLRRQAAEVQGRRLRMRRLRTRPGRTACPSPRMPTARPGTSRCSRPARLAGIRTTASGTRSGRRAAPAMRSWALTRAAVRLSPSVPPTGATACAATTRPSCVSPRTSSTNSASKPENGTRMTRIRARIHTG